MQMKRMLTNTLWMVVACFHEHYGDLWRLLLISSWNQRETLPSAHPGCSLAPRLSRLSPLPCARGSLSTLGALKSPKYVVDTLTVLSNQQYVFIRRNFLSWKRDALTVHHLIDFSFLKVKRAGYVLDSFMLCINTASCPKKKKKYIKC